MKKPVVIALITLVVIGIGVFAITQSPKWSLLEYEAVVQDQVTSPDGEKRLIVERTTNRYGDPLNSLSIGAETKLLDHEGKQIGLEAFASGSKVRVTLEDSFVEESPFYYPSVHEVQLL